MSVQRGKTDDNFRFLYRTSFDVAPIQRIVDSFTDDDWLLDTIRQEIFEPHKRTQSYFLNKVSLGWKPSEPLIPEFVSDNLHLWKYVRPITDYLEETCDGKIGQVLLIKLFGESEITPHMDQGEYLWHTCRHHVPIITNPGVAFIIEDEEKHMPIGECWEINNNKMHSVVNRGHEDRVHLLIDIIPNELIG